MNSSSSGKISIAKFFLLLKRSGTGILCIMATAAALTYIGCRLIAEERFDVKLYIYSKNGTSCQTAVNDCCELFKSKNVKSQLDDAVNRNWKKLQDIPYSFKIETKKNSCFIVCKFFSPDSKKALAAAIAAVDVFTKNVKEKMFGSITVQVIDAPARVEFLQRVPVFSICSISALVCGILFFAAYSIWNFYNSVITGAKQTKEELGISAVGVFSDISRHLAESRKAPLVHSLRLEESYNFDLIYEQFQSCLANLRFSLPSSHSGTVSILVTSTTSGEGKSFVSANIAQLLAIKRKRILLIGCDLRHPALHHYFQINRKYGLVNMVLGEKTFEETVIKNIDGLPLDILPSGPVPPDPLTILEMFCDSGFREKYAPDYDYVIYDCPPLNMADALYFAKHANHVLLVARSGATPIRLIRGANAHLKSLGFKISGIIINQAKTENLEPENEYSEFYAGFNNSGNRRGNFIKRFLKPSKKI